MLSLALAPALILSLSASPVKPAAEAASLTPAISPCAVDRDAAFARYVVPELHVNRSPIGQIDRAPDKSRPPQPQARAKAAPLCIQQVIQPLAPQDLPRPRS